MIVKVRRLQSGCWRFVVRVSKPFSFSCAPELDPSPTALPVAYRIACRHCGCTREQTAWGEVTSIQRFTVGFAQSSRADIHTSTSACLVVHALALEKHFQLRAGAAKAHAQVLAERLVNTPLVARIASRHI